MRYPIQTKNGPENLIYKTTRITNIAGYHRLVNSPQPRTGKISRHGLHTSFRH